MAESSTTKTPPSFGDSEWKDYTSWKKEIELWKRVTKTEKKSQAALIALSLTGKARQIAIDMDIAVLEQENGVEKLIEMLDESFKRDEVDCAYEAYRKFETFTRTPDVTVAIYVLEFERLYERAKSHKMTLPDSILGYKLLENACLETRERQMALTACEKLDFEKMQSAMRRIFGDGGTAQNSSTVLKEEPSYVASAKYRPKNYYQRSSESSRKPYYRPQKQGRNPLGRDGRITRCSSCGSVNHWFRDCPDRGQDNDAHHETTGIRGESVDIVTDNPEEVKAVVFVNQSLYNDSIKMTGIMDTACTSSVCGNLWLRDFVDKFPVNAQALVEDSCVQNHFVFGDGKSKVSNRRVKLPVEICGYRCYTLVDVLDGDLPLLFSRYPMKRMGAIIDTIRDEVTVFNMKQPEKLVITKSGHYGLFLGFTQRGQWFDESAEVFYNEILKVKEITLENKDIEKLHKQFSHCSAEKLFSLLQNAGYEDSTLRKRISDICSKCTICLGNARNRPRPHVGLPLASKFNDVIAMDLHQTSFKENIWFLHIIDDFLASVKQLL